MLLQMHVLITKLWPFKDLIFQVFLIPLPCNVIWIGFNFIFSIANVVNDCSFNKLFGLLQIIFRIIARGRGALQNMNTKRRAEEAPRTSKRKSIVAKVEESERENLFNEGNVGACSRGRYFGQGSGSKRRKMRRHCLCLLV